jgi:hypothetical protein
MTSGSIMGMGSWRTDLRFRPNLKLSMSVAVTSRLPRFLGIGDDTERFPEELRELFSLDGMGEPVWVEGSSGRTRNDEKRNEGRREHMLTVAG